MFRTEKQYPNVPGVVVIAGALHCKSREAFEALIDVLKDDYDIKDCMESDKPHEGHFCTLKDTVAQRFAKCDQCHHLNTTRGCKRHGFTCAGCNQIIYRDHLPKGLMRFTFYPEKREYGFGCIAHEIHHFDHVNGQLYLKAEPADYNGSYSTFPKEKAKTYLEEHSEYYTEVQIDGVWLLAIPYSGGGTLKDQCINPWEISRWHSDEDIQHYREVTIFKGTEYEGGLISGLPVPDSYMVHETYKRAPFKHDKKLSASIISMAGQVSRCDYYYQDGRSAFFEGSLNWMEQFIEHFTDLPMESDEKYVGWKRFRVISPKDGPGFIKALALWVQHCTGVKQWVEDSPNIGNLIEGACKIMNGQRMTSHEASVFAANLKDEKVGGEFMDIMGYIRRGQDW